MDKDNVEDEKCIYKNALKRIVALDQKMRSGLIQSGYVTGAEGSKYFSEAIGIAREAIMQGGMLYVKE